jgi:hypothetical protein
MLRPLRRLVSRSAPRALLAVAIAFGTAPRLAAAWPVGQDDEVILDDFSTTSKDGDVLTIKHADFKGTNLSRDEIVTMLTPDTSSEDETALVKRLKVAEMSIPTIEIAMKKGGVIRVHDVVGTDIDSGTVGKLGFSGIDGGGGEKDGPVSVKAGAFVMENVGLSDALDAASAPQRLSSMARLGHLSWEGIDVVAPDKDSGPGKTIHVALGSVDIRNAYQGDLFKDSTMSMKNLVIEPTKGSAMSDSLALFGYSRIEISLRIAAHYDAAAKKLSLGDLTLDGANAGAIAVKADFADVDPALFGSDSEARMAAVTSGAMTGIEFKFVNAGLFEKALAYFAGQQKTTPEALKQQWAATAGQMLPALLGGDPAALKVAAEAQKFVAAPTNLAIALRPKTGTFKFSDAAAAGDPMSLIAALDIVAVANK